MKWLAVMLVLANAAYFAWRYNTHVVQTTRARAEQQPLPSLAQPLKLLRELTQLPTLRGAESKQNTAVTAGAVGSTSEQLRIASAETLRQQSPKVTDLIATGSGASGVCQQIGPLPDAQDLERFSAWLGPRTVQLQRVSKVVRKRQLFWVYLQQPTEQLANQRLADLTRHGVEDVMLIQRSDLQHTISLGLFSSQEAVNRRLAEIGKTGQIPVVVPRFEVEERHWLRAHFAAEHAVASTLPRELALGVAQVAMDCEKIAAVNDAQ